MTFTTIQHCIAMKSGSRKQADTPFRKEVKQFLYADDMTVYLTSTGESVIKLTHTIKVLNNTAGYKINLEKSIALI